MRARDARASLCGARARGSKAGEKYLVWIDLRFFSARNSGEASAKKGYAEAGGRASRP